MMDPDYALFATIVEEGGLASAGRRLNISPAMVSKRLMRLETRLGARLIHRTTRRISLSPVGERLHADLRQILAALDEAERRVSGTSPDISEPLRLTAPTSFGRMHIVPYLAGFLDRHPGIALHIDLSDDFTDLFAARIDLAIRIAAEPGPGLAARRIATNRRILCAAPSYLDRFGTPDSIADLAGHRLLAADGQFPWRLSGPDGQQVIDGQSHVRTNSSEVVRELARSGAGIALRSLWDVSDALAQGALRQILPAYEGSRDVGLFAVYPQQPRPPRATIAFIDYLTEVFTPHPPWERAAIAPGASGL